MSEDLIIRQCSPTMAGLKTGSLFTCPAENKSELISSVKKFNRCLVPKGVRLMPLKYSNGRALMYMYRPDKLKANLSEKLASEILCNKSYPIGNPQGCIAELIKRLRNNSDFPHEIGLFLGYPSEDVNGFIKNGAKYAKCVGTWKVYGDEENARKLFARYKKCTEVYCECFRKHNSFDRLVVSCS